MKRPRCAYSRSKAESERVARRYQDQGAPVVITYPGGVIGPNDPYLGESNRSIVEFVNSGVTMRGGEPWVDVRDVAKVHAAVMKPGSGPRRYMVTGHYIAIKDLAVMLHEITGRHGRIVAMPAGAARVVGRVADLVQHIVPGRLPFNYEAMWITALQPHCDDSKTISELGISPRDLRVTVEDTVRWLADHGHIAATPARQAAQSQKSRCEPSAVYHAHDALHGRGEVAPAWLSCQAWRAGGLQALKPAPRADTGTVRTHPELFAEAAALRLELPGRSAAQIASILYHRHGIRVHERTIRAQLRRAGLHREALAAEPKTYGRYEAARPNERWISDVLIGPWVPFPRREGSVRARLFLIVDDHSRLLVDGRFFDRENAHACQDLLRRAVTRRGRRRCSIVITARLFPMRGWPAPARCWASAWSIPGRIRRKGGESRKGSTAISARHSWPRPPTTASSPWTSSTTYSPPGPLRSPADWQPRV